MTDTTYQSHRLRRVLAAGVEYVGLLVALGLLIGYFSYRGENFLTATTFRTLANQIPDAVVIAVGMTLVLMVGGIDLSVGSVMGLSGAVLGVLIVRHGWPVGWAVVGCLVVGALCGAVNGLVTITWRIPSFIVTLGMLEIARGAAYRVADSETQYIGRAIEPIAETTVCDLSVPFLTAMLLVVAGQVVLSLTVFGRRIRAVGEAEEVARLSGISPRPVKLAVFTLSGMLAALAAVFNTSRMSSADPNAGSGYELQAIAAVVIGGTSLLGGRGSVVRSFLGVAIIAVLGSGLSQIDVRDPTKRLITGSVIVGAVVLDYYRQRLRRGR